MRLSVNLHLFSVISMFVSGTMLEFFKNFNEFLAGLQSNSGLWIDDVCPSVCPSVRLSTFWLTSAFKFVLCHINQNRLDTLHGIDLDEISLTTTFPCDPDLDFFSSKSLNNFG